MKLTASDGYIKSYIAAILDLKVKIVSKLNGYYSIRSVVSKLLGSDTSYAPLANMVQEISLFLVFNMALAILKNGLLKYFPTLLGGARRLIQGRSQTFQNEGAARGGGATGTRNGGSP